MKRFLVIILLLFPFCLLSIFYGQDLAVKVDSKELSNFYRVSENLYRCDQPNKKAMLEIEKLGIKTVLNLRNRTNDNQEAKTTSLITKRVAINAWKMDYLELIKCLKIIQISESPIAVHCLHGSDRTGVVVAAYRMVFQNWSKEKAIEEFLEPEFGFHSKWFSNLEQLLINLDIDQCKKDLIN